MKKALLGTTALVASGLLAGAASAADIVPAPIPEPVEIEEGFVLDISADAVAGIWFGDTDECEGLVRTTGVEDGNMNAQLAAIGASGPVDGGHLTTSCAFNGSIPATDQFHDQTATIWYEHKVTFELSTTLASGLYAAAIMELESDDNDGFADSWIVLEGHFGSMEIGYMDGAYKNALVGGLDSGIVAEANGPKASPFNDINTSDGALDGIDGDAKISYYTPRYHGFQFGVSYAPGGDPGRTRFNNNAVHTYTSDDQWYDNWSIGANWEGTIHNNWDIAIGGGYGAGSAGHRCRSLSRSAKAMEAARLPRHIRRSVVATLSVVTTTLGASALKSATATSRSAACIRSATMTSVTYP